VGWRGLVRTIRHEAPFWAATLPQLPRLVHRALAEDRLGALHVELERIAAQNARRNRLLAALLILMTLGLVLFALNLG
jgi:ubiquinone biosynthesis protein